MTLILKQFFSFLKLLNSDTGEKQLAAGIACGMILGFAPSFSLQTLLVFIIIFFFRVQFGAAMLSAFFFSFLAYLLDPIFNSVGSMVLEMQSLRGIFTLMYNAPIIPFTRFYNSISMGSGVISLLLFPFLFVFSKILIVKYRTKIVARFQESKMWKVVKASSFYKWYAKYDELFG